jgi:hypothetical protein
MGTGTPTDTLSPDPSLIGEYFPRISHGGQRRTRSFKKDLISVKPLGCRLSGISRLIFGIRLAKMAGVTNAFWYGWGPRNCK